MNVEEDESVPGETEAVTGLDWVKEVLGDGRRARELFNPIGAGVSVWGDEEPVERRRRRLTDDMSFGDWADATMHRALSRPTDGRQVCDRCVKDSGLAQFVRYFAEGRNCDFCDRRYRTERTAPLNDLIRYIEGCLWQDYDNPENVLFYDSESESGFAGSVWDNEELLSDHLSMDWPLLEAVIAGFDPDLWWCEADPARFLPGDHLRVSWESFCEYVKHTSRFMFLRSDESGQRLFDEQDATLVQSTEMLDLFGEAVETCGLVTTLGVRTKLVRARAMARTDPWFTTADDLGPPPESRAGPPANRMNPAGISLIYIALDETTAVHEIFDSSGRASLGVFVPLRPLRLLDLRSKRPVPHHSIFENVPSLARGLAGFVEAFREEIARPVERDGREHVEYVPSQIVTEYIRRVFRSANGERLDGVLYPSSRRPGGVCAALFVTRSEIQGCKDRWRDPILSFRPKSPRRIRVKARGGRLSLSYA